MGKLGEGIIEDLQARVSALEKRLVRLEAWKEGDEPWAIPEATHRQRFLALGIPVRVQPGVKRAWLADGTELPVDIDKESGRMTLGLPYLPGSKGPVAVYMRCEDAGLPTTLVECSEPGCDKGARPRDRKCPEHLAQEQECDHKPTQGVGGQWECYKCGKVLEQEPKPVATVGQKCPVCNGKGHWDVSFGFRKVREEVCTVCLGAGIVHSDAEFQRVAKELERYRRALNIATYRVNPTAHEYLHKADAELAAEAECGEAMT